jgi:hypothetical protein
MENPMVFTIWLINLGNYPHDFGNLHMINHGQI